MTDFLETPQGRRIAYHFTPGQGPTVVFLGGFKSDMEGTKAVHLEAWAKERGQAFLRFDYSGHGESGGAFTEGCIGEWAEDAYQVITATAPGAVVLVGSSMGGWISLLMTKRLEGRVAGLVGIAAAPDFTEDGYWAKFDDAQRAELAEKGMVLIPSEYGAPYEITAKLIEDGRNQLVLRDPLPLDFPVRFLQGTADDAVSTETALRLLDHAEGEDIRLTLVKDADHRFSTPDCLTLIETSVQKVLARTSGQQFTR